MGSVLIGIAAIAAFVIPVVFIHKHSQKKGEKRIQQLLNAAKEKNVNVSEYDFCNETYFLGLDAASKTLYYNKNIGGVESSLVVPLTAFNAIRVSNVSRSSGSVSIVDRVCLAATPIKKGESDVLIELYDSGYSPSVFESIEMAKKWAAKLNAIVAPS